MNNKNLDELISALTALRQSSVTTQVNVVRSNAENAIRKLVTILQDYEQRLSVLEKNKP